MTSTFAAVLGLRPGSSTRRSAATKVRTAPSGSPGSAWPSHRSATRRGSGTTWRRATRSRASTAR
ncbi:hypothetical protein [Streptomyces sp. TverLS-915]|uniref:hypothetical protein n=1 Tax=Streptomyces sp. TverLS-915 TaxID=1839763 RepID=UPI00351F5C04